MVTNVSISCDSYVTNDKLVKNGLLVSELVYNSNFTNLYVEGTFHNKGGNIVSNIYA